MAVGFLDFSPLVDVTEYSRLLISKVLSSPLNKSESTVPHGKGLYLNPAPSPDV
jgi:hypothetical protein